MLIAGGIGITPILAMAHQLKAANKPFKIHYSAKTPQKMAFRKLILDHFEDETDLHFDGGKADNFMDLAESDFPWLDGVAEGVEFNNITVTDITGEKVFMGTDGKVVSSTTDTDATERTPVNPIDMTKDEYRCTVTDFDTVIKFAFLDNWAKFPDFEARIGDPAMKDQLRRNTDAAIERGVFGIPTFVIDKELFWGDDVTGMMLDYLENPDLFKQGGLERLHPHV